MALDGSSMPRATFDPLTLAWVAVGARASARSVLQRNPCEFGSVSDPRRYLMLFQQLLGLPLEELEAIVRAVTQAYAD